jgi:HAMP domain-containing protein
LIVGLLAFAQRLGGWEHKPLARCLGFTAGALFVMWCFLFLPSWVGWTALAAVWTTSLWFIFSWTQEPLKRLLNRPSRLGVIQISKRPAENVSTTPAPKNHPEATQSPLRVEFVPEGLQGKLVFKTRGKPLRIHRIGDLTCEEIYRTEYEINLLAQAFAELDQSRPLECRISGIRNRDTRTSA